MNAKFIVCILAVLALSVSSALAIGATTVVHGKVLNPDSSPAGSGIVVTVECDNGVVATQTPSTDANSEYQAEFSDDDCWVGDTVYASVPGDSKSAIVVDDTTVLGSLILQIDLEIPEFSAIAAGIAFAGAGASFMLLRRRK